MTTMTYLGHAGFKWETDGAILIIDPWVSPYGAFDSGWFQLPRNHDQEQHLLTALAASDKKLLIYLSHHHKDHFDLEFLAKVPAGRATLLLPRYERDPFARYAQELSHLRRVYLTDQEIFAFPGGYLQPFIDDSGINRDSGLYVRSPDLSFFDMNDAKLHERLRDIKRQKDEIDVFACQFSGATWHPVCYQYPPRRRAEIAREKVRHKFEGLARSIELLAPRLFLPSAGPACFLDPELFELNFEDPTSFPRAPAVERFLAQRLRSTPTVVETLAPGDTVTPRDGHLDLGKRDTGALAGQDRDLFRAQLVRYQADYLEHFRGLKTALGAADRATVFDRLGKELVDKLQAFELRDDIPMPLYIGLREDEDRWLRVAFDRNDVSVVDRITDDSFYSVSSPAWQLARVLDRKISWEDWYLTFRARLHRQPDEYCTLLNGFLWMEIEDLPWFCGKMREHHAKRERARLEWNGCVYEIDRYCPHQGADLTEGFITADGHLVCPRHRWRFDLQGGGKCASNFTSIDAKPLTDAADSLPAVQLPSMPPPRRIRAGSPATPPS